jgi:NAD+ synthase (glutamine-hydrolysing)
VRITQRAFGRDWRYPITNKFRAWYFDILREI